MRDLILPPAYGNRRAFPWLIVFRRGQDNRPPIYFLTVGQNWKKFADREEEGFRIIGHVKEKNDAIEICAEMNRELRGERKKRRGYQISSTKNEAALRQNKLWIPPTYRKD